MKAWTSTDGYCFACCVGAILDLGEEAESRLAALPKSFVREPQAMANYNAALRRSFGVTLRQLNAPPANLRPWIAALRINEDKGHAVVARERTIIFDPNSEGRGRWGQWLPASFGYDLVDGFELVPL